ncbi:hypothetical protein HJG60_008346 [Phyllostomus discolor]|uniref:Uncharacterized protein n=1 Tax=Phyllostomus discolor TaxID=89673 RepID=A0A833Z902_9CHIR|nr:hypothetical protein HJG60_008346 [Phyllostomus discolor]
MPPAHPQPRPALCGSDGPLPVCPLVFPAPGGRCRPGTGVGLSLSTPPARQGRCVLAVSTSARDHGAGGRGVSRENPNLADSAVLRCPKKDVLQAAHPCLGGVTLPQTGAGSWPQERGRWSGERCLEVREPPEVLAHWEGLSPSAPLLPAPAPGRCGHWGWGPHGAGLPGPNHGALPWTLEPPSLAVCACVWGTAERPPPSPSPPASPLVVFPP